MAIKFIVVGNTKEKFYRQSEDEYLKRLNKYCKLQYVVIPSSKKSILREECLRMEEEQLQKHIGQMDYVILMDEKGEEYSSRKFAKKLNENLVHRANLTFIIGGAFGFSDVIRARANDLWSLSRLTFPHHLVRTIFLEQLYRAFTILNGEKYHND
ncbi:MAG: 23S rRNA (pseudouridine(1915)-N(3))-methyltransferase RlmH [Bacteroidetes bacterium]|nr:MAG: 23S rRNA (pseudouridine(1915)-N(3))-methyltransferase RlmH [Bacteroidota bacterium]